MAELTNGIITVVKLLSDSVELSIDKGTYKKVRIAYRESTSSSLTTIISKNNTETIDGLTVGTTYVLNAEYIDSSGAGVGYEGSITITPLSEFDGYSIDATYVESSNIITSDFGYRSFNYAYIDWFKSDSLNDLFNDSNKKSDYADPEITFDFEGDITSNTTYYIGVGVYDSNEIAVCRTYVKCSTYSTEKYTITIYMDDLSINKTKYEVIRPSGEFQSGNSSGVTHAKGISRTINNVYNGSTITVSCIDSPQNKNFYEWRYRFGSTSGALHTSSENEFTLTITDNLYIRAVGKYGFKFFYKDSDGHNISDILYDYVINDDNNMPHTFNFSTGCFPNGKKYAHDIVGYEYDHAATKSDGIYSTTASYTAEKNGGYKSFYLFYNKLISTITPWSWVASNGSASTTQTKNAYDAIMNNGKLSDFSYLVWNDLCDKTNEALIEVGGSWETTSGKAIEEDKMSDTDKILTAVRFNDLMYNIKRPLEGSFGYDTSNYATNFPRLVADVNKGDPVYGEHFIQIAKLLNVFIDKINGS